MTRVSLSIDEIRQRMSGNACLIHSGRIWFANAITSSDVVKLSVTRFDTSLEVENLPDRYLYSAIYYILHRSHIDIAPEKANYYRRMFEIEYAKVKHNDLVSGRSDWGTDL